MKANLFMRSPLPSQLSYRRIILVDQPKQDGLLQ
ncbi:MAG: hypothetical protein ACI9WS_003092, partial [Paraglaciecola psychrophila]